MTGNANPNGTPGRHAPAEAGSPPPHAGSAFAAGQRHTLNIEDLAFGGDGAGRVREFVVFVPFVIPGEEVEVELTEVKKSFARARLVRVISPSAQRVAPKCPYFGECGGCQYQHVAYPAQLEFKRKQVADLFQRVGGFDPGLVGPVLGCPQPYGYRNRIMLRTQWDKFKQGLNIGYLRHDNRLVVDIEQCPIAEPALNQQIQQVRAHPPPKGGLKVVLRVMPEDWEVARDSFFQNNFLLLPQLVAVVRESLRRGGLRRLIDAYCGVGFFSLELADLVERYVGIEVDDMAIAAARRNARRRGRTNGDFILGRTEAWLPRLLDQDAARASSLLLDPPRTGCPRPSLELLRQIRPGQVIYVSCHPATLARDLNILCGDGVFELKQVTPLDMFPQTQHVECVADVRRGGGDGADASGSGGLVKPA